MKNKEERDERIENEVGNVKIESSIYFFMG